MVADKPTVISLFAGCGGSSLGYQMAGYKELLAVEWDKHAAATFRLNFPDVPVYEGDIAKFSVTECLQLAGISKGELDVLDSSPPCQGFSMAGKREFRDARNQLGFEVVRLAEGLQPRVIIMENVASMVQGATRMLYLDIVKGFQKAGYKTKAAILNAMYFGVPQHRRRLILVGVRKDLGIEPSHPKPQKGIKTVKDAIGDLSNVQDESREHVWIDESPAGRNTQTWHLAYKTEQGKKYRFQQRRDKWNAPASTIIKPGSDHMEIPPYLGKLNCHPLFTRTYSGLEIKRLSSFPDGFKIAGEWWRTFYQIGNSIPPLMMKAIAEHVKTEILEKVKLVTE